MLVNGVKPESSGSLRESKSGGRLHQKEQVKITHKQVSVTQDANYIPTEAGEDLNDSMVNKDIKGGLKQGVSPDYRELNPGQFP